MAVSTRLQGEQLGLKARDPDPQVSATTCQSLAGEASAVLFQHDTYFQGPRGRLKLRQQSDGGAYLFAYERLTVLGQPERQWLFEIHQPEVVMEAFSESLGVEAVVEKRRQPFLWRGVHIHLDAVEGLGSFIKLKPSSPKSGLASEELARTLRQALQIDEADLVTESYCDLLLGSAET